MWCQRFWLMYTLVSMLTLMVSSAPSEKRPVNMKPSSKLKQLMQAEPRKTQAVTKNAETEEHIWYPTVELISDRISHDYPSEIAAEQNAKSKSSGEHEKTEKKMQAGKYGQSLNGLVVTTKSIVDEHDSLAKNEVKRLRELITEIAEKIGELQQLKTDCANNVKTEMRNDDMGRSSSISTARKSSNAKTVKTASGKSSSSKNEAKGAGKSSKSDNKAKDKHGPISEVEEKHIVQIKFQKANGHQENKHGMSAVGNFEKTETGKAPAVKITSTNTTFSSPGASADYSKNQESSKTVGQSSTKALDVSSNTIDVSSNAVDIMKDPADVNYNGGIQRPMDDLKREYPNGFWPDDDLDNGDADDNTDDDESENNDEAAEDDYYEEENYVEERGPDEPKEEDGKKDYQEYGSNNTLEPSLTPEYLEKIIQQERDVSKENPSERLKSTHHIQEHEVHFKK